MPGYQRLVAAQTNFEKVMYKVNQTVAEGIEQRRPEPHHHIVLTAAVAVGSGLHASTRGKREAAFRDQAGPG